MYTWSMAAPWCSKCYRTYTGNLNLCNLCQGIPDSDIPPTKFVKSPYLVREEEKKMIVTIIGSYSKVDKMKECKEFWERFGHKVYCPCDSTRDKYSLIEKQGEWIEKIKEADLVVAIEKEFYVSGEAGKTDYVLKFGESTSYEMAIALHFNKQIVFW